MYALAETSVNRELILGFWMGMVGTTSHEGSNLFSNSKVFMRLLQAAIDDPDSNSNHSRLHGQCLLDCEHDSRTARSHLSQLHSLLQQSTFGLVRVNLCNIMISERLREMHPITYIS